MVDWMMTVVPASSSTKRLEGSLILLNIPPEGGSRISFYKELIARLEITSQVHIGWYTHKNPYGCWICDMVLLLRTLLNLLEQQEE